MTTTLDKAPAAEPAHPAPNKLKEIWSNFFGFLQKLGKSLMLPVAVLPVAGILLGVGGAFLGNYSQSAINLGYCSAPGGVSYSGDVAGCRSLPASSPNPFTCFSRSCRAPAIPSSAPSA